MSDKESFDHSIEEDKHAIAQVKGQVRKPHRGTIGFAIAVSAMLVILLWQSTNLSTVLSRRSPFMEYTVCYNERDSAERKAYNELLNLYIGKGPADMKVVIVKTKAYNDAAELLTEATDLNSPQHCPGLEVLKDK